MQAAPTTIQERAEALESQIFLGGPVADFERVGRLGLDVLLREGLKPESRVLDVGCGALRLGVWLMRLLNPGCYFGIEPNRGMLEAALRDIVEPSVAERARARFAHNDDFDLLIFDEPFDYVYARSIWTHASKKQIAQLLRTFARASTPDGVLLASYHPASRTAQRALELWPRGSSRLFTVMPLHELSPLVARLPMLGTPREYEGDEWVGLSHMNSSQKGVVRHSLRWLRHQAAEFGLDARLAGHPIVNRQYWIRVTHA
jgi:ubiquinone/menaquinone biosynthesis C-methylase UbiE